MPDGFAPAWIAARVVEAVERGERVDAAAALLLAREYEAGADAVAGALAVALTAGLSDPNGDPAGWVAALSGAAAISADSRIADALREQASGLGAQAPRDVEARLRAAAALDDGALVRGAIDELERLVRDGYAPGAGIERDGTAVARDQVDAASALLTAYDITGRLPYAMLADELMRTLLRTTRPDAPSDDDFFASCAAASVWCRLAALYDDEEYARQAVVGATIDYAAEAAALLARLDGTYRARGWRAAPFGLAVLDYVAAGGTNG